MEKKIILKCLITLVFWEIIMFIYNLKDKKKNDYLIYENGKYLNWYESMLL